MLRSVLITGGAGFIGSSLVRQACEAFDEVWAVDNLVNGKRENLLGDDLPNLKFVEDDIRHFARMKEILSGIDTVYHLACLGVRHSIHSPVENHDVNATATLNLLELSRECGVRRFVYVSSSEIYGTARKVPICEETPAYPHTVYGGSKLAGDCYARAYWDTYRFPTTIIRPFNSYGPRCHHEGDSGEVIPKFILRAMAGKPLIVFGDGKQTRDFMYVEETAYWILQAGMEESTIGETINLGSGVEIEIRELARKVLEAVGRPDGQIKYDHPRPGDVLRLLADTTKAQRELNFASRISLDEGLEKLVAWYKSHPKRAEHLLQDELERNWERG